MDKDRRLAYLILKDMEQKEAYSNLVINSYLKEGADNPAFIRELVYGVLRNQLLLDWNVKRFLTKGGRLKPGERVLLRMGFYQLAMMDSVPEYAAVGETVKLASAFMKGRQGFINGVLRSFARSGSRLEHPVEAAQSGQLERPAEATQAGPSDQSPVSETKYLSIVYSCDESIVKLWLEAYGRRQTEEMLKASLEPAPLTIRVNTLKITPENLKERLEKQGFAVTSGCLSRSYHIEGSGLIDTKEFKDGLFQVQDLASQLAVETLNPQPGDTLIDLCAAPGGKCCAAAILMENRGTIKAFDYYQARAGLIAQLASRLGIDIISASQADAGALKDELVESADCVICDVPCSGLGVIRRKPEIKLRPIGTESDGQPTTSINSDTRKHAAGPASEPLPEKQIRILHNGAKYVNLKGGKLLYSTCTVNPKENGEIVRRFLREQPGFTLEKELQLFPGESDGFYICLLRRQNDQRRIQN